MSNTSIPRALRAFVLGVMLVYSGGVYAEAVTPANPGAGTTPGARTKVLAVDSPAFVFSPGNWVGDDGRAGKQYRQTWNPGAYFRVTWECKAKGAAPTLLLDTSTYDGSFTPPILAANLDGIWSGELPCAKEISIPGQGGAGRHVLTVYVKKTEQIKRWGTPGTSGANVVRVTGLRVDAASTPAADAARPRWALIVGDSITEGVGAYDLEGYSHLVGQALVTQGYEYALSACGWSGWLFRGDNPPGDVPGYYVITQVAGGAGGQYHEAESRWNKIDANHSLLDSRGHLSAYGREGQEPSVILINYGTNDAIHGSNPDDVRASITQCLEALRRAAPAAQIFMLVPFGQYKAGEIHAAVRARQAAEPPDRRIAVIDLGPETARALTVPGNKGYWGGLHPNARAHATLAVQIIARMIPLLPAGAVEGR